MYAPLPLNYGVAISVNGSEKLYLNLGRHCVNFSQTYFLQAYESFKN